MQPQTPTATTPRTYQTPTVRDLGPWKAVTLEYSVPFNGVNNVTSPFGSRGNNGY